MSFVAFELNVPMRSPAQILFIPTGFPIMLDYEVAPLACCAPMDKAFAVVLQMIPKLPVLGE